MLILIISLLLIKYNMSLKKKYIYINIHIILYNIHDIIINNTI